MRILPIALTALALSPKSGATDGHTCKMPARDIDEATQPPGIRLAFPGAPNYLSGLFQRDNGMANLATRWNKCVDVKDSNYKPGNMPQLWDCVQGNKNQQWTMSGMLVQTNSNLCLDAKDGAIYNGSPVQLWTCDANNRNQWFEKAGNGLRKVNTNFCLDVKDGHYDNGAGLQMWNCDWQSAGNQVFQFGQVTQTTTQSASSFLGYSAISADRFSQLHPECARYQADFVAAAAATGLVPSLLGAIAETESSCQEAPRNGWGLMQFSDDGAWRMYGDGGNRQKASDAIWAGARYIRDLLNQNNQNLDNALRAYNGPLSQGGNPGYQNEIRTWMSGGSTW